MIALLALPLIPALAAAVSKRRSPRHEGIGYVKGQAFRLALTPIVAGYFLRADAALAYLHMAAAARRAGVVLVINTAFRTQEEQAYLFQAYQSGMGNFAVRPGHSNHQGGIAVDIETAGGTNAAFVWLTLNAARFGFKRTVPSEPWHWEYHPEELQP